MQAERLFFEFTFVYHRLLRRTLHCICLLCLLFELVLGIYMLLP